MIKIDLSIPERLVFSLFKTNIIILTNNFFKNPKMKKFFFLTKTLLAVALLTVASNAWGAATYWKVSSSTKVTANQTYVSTDYLTIASKSAGTLTGYNYTYSDIGSEVSKSIQIRSAAAPSAENPSGTDNSGSTRLVLTVASEVDVAFYYRRQADDGASSNCTYTENNAKDLYIVNQNAPTEKLTGTMTKESDCKTTDTYGHVKKAYTLAAGTYTVYALGTTIQLNAISYELVSLYPYSVGTSTAATYLQHSSPVYTLTGNGTINTTFDNHCDTGKSYWFNWHLICGNTSDSPSVGDVNTNRLFVMRADRWENIAGSSDDFSNVSGNYFDGFMTHQNGATVNLSITRSGTTVKVVTTVTKDEDVRSMTYTKTKVTDETLKFYVTGSNSYLTIDPEPTITKNVSPNWDFTDTSVWSTSKFSSEATYAPDGTAGTLGATGITFNLSGKVNSITADGGMSFSSSASATLEGNIPTNNYIKVSVPAGYKASVECYGYNSGRYLGFTFGGEKMYVPTNSTGGFQNHTKKEFDNSTGDAAKDLYLYAVNVSTNGHVKIYSINIFNASGTTHSWTATAKATINGVATEIDTWNSTEGNYTTTIHEGENYFVPAKRVITYGGKYYEVNDENYSGDYLFKTYNMGIYDASYDIAYTEASDIVYFSELEDFTNKNHTQSNQASSGKYVGNMTAATAITSPASFPAGNYKVEANMFDRKPGQTTNFYIYKTSAESGNIVANFAVSNNDNGKKTRTFALDAAAQLLVGTSTSASCDYILIRRVNETKSISALGWATYCSPYPLDFSGDIDNLTDAFIVTGGADGVLAKTSVKGGKVAANTGLLLKGSEGTVTIPVATSGTDYSTTNKLVGVTSETAGVAAGIYVLLNGVDDTSGPVGFYKTANAFTISANTAYLPADFTSGVTPAREAYFFDGVTGINEAEAATEAVVKEGKFIEGGKLVIFKKGMKFNANGQVIK